MSSLISGETNRRAALQIMGAAALSLPLLDRLSPIHEAAAQTDHGVRRSTSELVFIPAAAADAVPMAEWEGILGGAENGVSSNRVAIGKDISKAPANASHYDARTFQYPSGALRTLTFRKGGPIYHQITFETEIFVVQGSVTLTPLYGLKGESAQINAGDALYLPSGVLRNPNPTEDTILLLAQVASTSKNAKAAIVRAGGAVETVSVQWQADGKEFSASKPEEVEKAPPNALRSTVTRYAFDGNSFRFVNFKKGGKGNVYTTTRSDVLIYIPKGRLRRTEGNQTFEMVAGDTTREKIGNPGFWEPLEDSAFIATDAQFDPSKFASIGITL